MPTSCRAPQPKPSNPATFSHLRPARVGLGFFAQHTRAAGQLTMLLKNLVAVVVALTIFMTTAHLYHQENSSETLSSSKQAVIVELHEQLAKTVKQLQQLENQQREALQKLTDYSDDHSRNHHRHLIGTTTMPGVDKPIEGQASGVSFMQRLGNIDMNLKVGNPELRDDWIASKAKSLALPEGGAVLDVSAGAKPYQSVFEASGWKYYSSEFTGNEKVVDGFRGETEKKDLKRSHDYVSSDISNIGAPSDTFDLVVLTEVLEHVPEPSLAIAELARVAKPGANILITSPFTSGSHQLPFHFSSGYSREWYYHFAKKYNLEIVEVKSQGNYFKLMAQEVERSFTCGASNPGQDQAAVEELKHAAFWYLLQKSSVNTPETAPCYDQFTIGWMVQLQKKKQ